MTSPYTGTVATPSTDASPETDIPRTTLHERSAHVTAPTTSERPASPAPRLHHHEVVSQSVHAPVVQQAPVQHPGYHIVTQATQPRRGESLMMSLVAIILAVIAAGAAYTVTKAKAPTDAEIQAYQRIAAGEGELAGRLNGWQMGRQQGIVENREIARYQGLIASAQHYNKGWKQGMRDGESMFRNRGYGGYYRGTSYGWGGGGGVWSALNSAQVIANSTGMPVDVEIY